MALWQNKVNPKIEGERKSPSFLTIVLIILLGLLISISAISTNKIILVGLFLIVTFMLIIILPFEYSIKAMIIIGIGSNIKIHLGAFNAYLGGSLLILSLWTALLMLLVNNPKGYRLHFNSAVIVSLLFLGYLLIPTAIGIEKGHPANFIRQILMAFSGFLAVPLVSLYIKDSKKCAEMIKLIVWGAIAYVVFFILFMLLNIHNISLVNSYRFRYVYQLPIIVFMIYYIQLTLDKITTAKYLWLKLTLVIISLIILVISQNRSMWGAFGIGIIVLILLNFLKEQGVKRVSAALKIILASVGLIAIILVVITISASKITMITDVLFSRAKSFSYLSEDPAYQSRHIANELFPFIFHQNPIFGQGIGLRYSATFKPDNNYWYILLDMGLVGFFFFLLLLAEQFWSLLISFINLRYIPNPYLKAFVVSQLALFPGWLAAMYVEALFHLLPTVMLFAVISATANYIKHIALREKRKALLNETR